MVVYQRRAGPALAAVVTVNTVQCSPAYGRRLSELPYASQCLGLVLSPGVIGTPVNSKRIHEFAQGQAVVGRCHSGTVPSHGSGFTNFVMSPIAMM